jgi:hypothetical protein
VRRTASGARLKPDVAPSGNAVADHAEDYLEAYREHSKVLRTWFVAYGIGAPALRFTNGALSRTVEFSLLTNRIRCRQLVFHGYRAA